MVTLLGVCVCGGRNPLRGLSPDKPRRVVCRKCGAAWRATQQSPNHPGSASCVVVKRSRSADPPDPIRKRCRGCGKLRVWRPPESGGRLGCRPRRHGWSKIDGEWRCRFCVAQVVAALYNSLPVEVVAWTTRAMRRWNAKHIPESKP